MATTRKATATKSVDPPAAPQRVAGSSEGSSTAKLFMHGRSQAVRLPKEFRFPGKEVRIRRVDNGVLLEPLEFDVDAWFKRLDSHGDVPFMPEGREQPEMPPGDEIDFDK